MRSSQQPVTIEGHYICTLTLTDVHSGWTETRALLNKAHRWVKEAMEEVKEKRPCTRLFLFPFDEDYFKKTDRRKGHKEI